MVYHIIKKEYWKKFENSNIYFPAEYENEGFIHFSTKDQVAGVLERYYANEENLVLLSINEDLLSAEMKFEKASNGELFPHLYGHLNQSAIVTKIMGNQKTLLESLD